MSSALVHKEGPYLYGAGGKVAKTFETGGAPRSFTLVLYGAEDHGIIGSELNGIAVLDDDNMQVLLKRHVQEASGFSGPSARQRAEFERIRAMDWTAFTDFVRGSSLYQGGMPDIRSPKPDEGRAQVSDRVVYPVADKPTDPACPYDFGLTTRRQIVDFLKKQSFHDLDRDGYAPSWNIKVRDFDETGRSVDPEGKALKARHDLRWEKKVEADKEGAMFYRACEDCLRQYTEGDFSTYVQDTVDAKFQVEGRSGGHLCLVELEGMKLVFHSGADWHRWLEDEDECDDTRLVRLYQAVVTLDHDLRSPSTAISNEYASQRQYAEEDWNAEFKDLPEAERMEILEAEAKGCRIYVKDGEWFAEGRPDDDDDLGPFDDQVGAARAFMSGPEVAPSP